MSEETEKETAEASRPDKEDPDDQRTVRAEDGPEGDPRSAQEIPFDSIFKTVMARMKLLMLPLLNNLFGSKFTGEEQVKYGTTEMVEREADGHLRTIRADSHITVVKLNGKQHIFHIECQTGRDGQIVLRFFEYDMQLALQEPVVAEDGIGFPVPESAVVYLRPAGRNARNPKYWLFDPSTGERLLEREIKAIYVAKLTMDQLFAEKLYALLPFYLFTHGSQLSKLVVSAEGREELVREAEKIADRIASEEALTPEQQVRLLELMGIVARDLLKSEETAKEISEIMQAHVLELDIDQMLEASKVEGKIELLVQMGQSSGQTEEEIVQNVALFLGMDPTEAQVLYENYKKGKRDPVK